MITGYCEKYSNNLCENGGTCVNAGTNDYKCVCLNGYSGRNCATNEDDCIEHSCTPGSTCIDGIAKYTCACPPGKIGLFCHLDDPCMQKPCGNGSECIADTASGEFLCNCMRGTTGPNCATDINECIESEKLCFNGGICVNTFGSWYCDCPVGYNDPYCMIHENECDPNPCLNGASCLDYGNRYESFYGKNCEKTCPPGFEDRTCKQRHVSLDNNHLEELFEKQICLLHNCSSKSANNVCDSECNYPACQYDGFDCSAHLQPFRHCPLPDFCARVFHDNKCDLVCDRSECLLDGFDCNEKKERCLFEDYCSTRFNDGYCDQECFTEECYFDGVDCKQNIAYTKLEGSLSLIILMGPDEFLKRAPVLQFILSQGMKARVTIAVDNHNRKRFFSWKADTNGLNGTKVYLNIETAQCHEEVNCRRDISDVEQAADFIGAMNFPLTLLEGECKSNGNMESRGMTSERISNDKQPNYFTEVYVVPDPEDGEIDKSLVNVRNKDGKSALMLTALNQTKSEEASCTDVENLFLAGALIDAEDDCGETALIMAVKAGRAEVVKCFLRFGADIATCDIHNRTALHHAASINAADIIRILLETEEIEIDAIDDTDCSALMTVAKLGYRDPETVALLINAGADINCTGNHINGETYKGRTALHYAVMQSNQELARYLVERGANLNIQDHMGQTPLFLAASQGHVEMVHMLVAAGARRYIPDNMDQTPEDIASEKEYKEVTQYFTNLRTQNGSATNGNGRSKMKNVKKPRIIEVSPTSLEMVLNSVTTASMTPESSNSSNSSTLLNRSKEHYNLNSHLSCETTTQLPNSLNTIPQQNSQHPIQASYSSTDHTANQSYNMQNGYVMNVENGPVASTPFLGFEYYV
ncbi:unnamed protein product [Litomosoides sigmodontis]|uniref:Uncharacterized protein n=1 Tax=Litomosoides sigmodontis TaxID=42156 RepID=A0A3P6SX56_LITSI|nr:unnamed protein product [Litomosoides sigmodontis]